MQKVDNNRLELGRAGGGQDHNGAKIISKLNLRLNTHSLIAAYNSRHGEKCFPSYVFIIKKSRQIAVCNNLLPYFRE